MSNPKREPETPNGSSGGEHPPADPRQQLFDTIATKLRSARESRGEPIEQPARQLKINAGHLRALEQGEWEELPGEVYVIGFLRQYSQYLQIDISQEIARLKASDYQLTRPLTFPDPPLAPSRRWAWISAAAFVALFIIFNITQSGQHERTIVAENSSEPAATMAPTPDVGSDRSLELSHHLPDRPAAGSEPESPTGSPEQSSGNNAPTTAATASRAQRIIPADSIPTTTDQANVSPQLPTNRYTFYAIGADVWLQIAEPNPSRNGRGRHIKELLLRSGHHFTIEHASDTLWITCGNAPALRIDANGKTIAEAGSLGHGKRVLRNVKITIPR